MYEDVLASLPIYIYVEPIHLVLEEETLNTMWWCPRIILNTRGAVQPFPTRIHFNYLTCLKWRARRVGQSRKFSFQLEVDQDLIKVHPFWTKRVGYTRVHLEESNFLKINVLDRNPINMIFASHTWQALRYTNEFDYQSELKMGVGNGRAAPCAVHCLTWDNVPPFV